MHTKTMEGLAGASMNMKLLNTPFRVYKDAERRGDTAVMERAMGYVGEFADKAEDYQKKAEKGMEEDAKEAREKAKTEQENAIRKRKEEREEPERGYGYRQHQRKWEGRIGRKDRFGSDWCRQRHPCGRDSGCY